MERQLNIGFTVQTMLDIITHSSFIEHDVEKIKGDNADEKKKKIKDASKHKFFRMKDYSFKEMTEAEKEKYDIFVKEINEWFSRAKEKGYLKDFQQTAIADFFEIMTDVAVWDMPLNQNMAEHFICYVLSKVLYGQLKEYMKNNPHENKYCSMYNTLAIYDFFSNDENYQTDYLPLENTFLLLEFWVKDFGQVIKYWEEKLLDKEYLPNLKLYLKRWKNGVIPEWKVIKLFLENDLCPPDEYFKDYEGVSDKSQFYKTFKASLFMSFLLENMFDSFVKRGVLKEDSRKMIRNGVRLFYRDFYIIRNKESKEYSEKFEPEAKKNLMFRTMFCMLDGTLSEVDPVQYMKSVEQNPKYPIVGNTWLDVLRSIFYRQDI